MKGIIFNLLQQAVEESYGAKAWNELIKQVGVVGTYTAVGTYPDQDLFLLVGAASRKFSMSPDDVVRWYGRASIPMLATRFPAFFEPHTSTRSFVLTLNDAIHPEVRRQFPGAQAPHFEVDDSQEETLELSYISHRKLCSFAEGLLEGVAHYYGEIVQLEQTECMKTGAERCVFLCRFSEALTGEDEAQAL